MASLQTQFMSGHLSHGPDVVYITRTEYDDLLRVSKKYENLCQSLRQGGCTENAIALLSAGAVEEPMQPATVAPTRASTQAKSQNARPSLRSTFTQNDRLSVSRNQDRSSSLGQYTNTVEYDTENDSSSEDVSFVPESLEQDVPISYGPRIPQRSAKRSIYIGGLPNDADHADVTAAITGGQILEIFLLRRDRAAIVAFLYGEDAESFRSHYSKHDLYIGDKRVTVDWAERHYNLPGHIAHQVAAGHAVSRNFVIRNYDPNLTERDIREDLEHIHQLVVIKVRFHRGDCFISTNSIRNAMFARTCMTSRQKFKGYRIQWDGDECNVPLPQVPEPTRYPEPPVTRTLNPLANRFELLSFDDSD